MKKAFDEARAQKLPPLNFAALLIDLDNFKQLNDTLGHQKGDEALQDVAKILRQHFREYDILCRLGGDEFIVFMTNIENASAVEAKGAEILDILAKSETTPHFTVSIGAAAYPAAGNDYESLYLAADNAMYASKKSGKNRIYVDDHKSIALRLKEGDKNAVTDCTGCIKKEEYQIRIYRD